MFRGIFFLFVIFFFFGFNAALRCVTCSWYASRPYNNYGCLEYNGSSSIDAPSRFCSRYSYFSFSYPYYPTSRCYTRYTYRNGIISRINRGCKYNTPTVGKCNSTSFLKSSSYIECYSLCQNNSCNTDKPERLRNLRCVQCNSETDPNCETKTTTSNCSGLADKYCAVTLIRRFDNNRNQFSRFLSRNCTASFVGKDSCQKSISDSGNITYTCRTTCNSNGCNTGIPDDSPTDDRLRCVVCDSRYGVHYCATATSTRICPSSATHCTAEVSYFISIDDNRVNGSNGEYKLINVTRGCSSSTVAKECKELNIPELGLKKVTCTESCSEDGCNTGWPARPKCSQCSCSKCSPQSLCYAHPAEPTSCSFPYQKYCVVEDRNRAKSDKNEGFIDGYSRSIVRYCSRISSGNQCEESDYNPKTLENCNRSCTEDWCNLGSGVSATLTSAHLYLLPLIFLCIIACIF